MLIQRTALAITLALAAPASTVLATEPAAPTLAPPSTAFAADLDEASQRRADAVEKALAAGNGEEALELANLALEYVANSHELFELASRAADLAGQKDIALWYLRRAREIALAADDDARPDKKWMAGVEERRASLDPRHAEYDALVEAHAAVCFELGKSSARRKLWANAVRFFKACEGTQMADKAKKELAKVYKKDDAVDALVASGLDIEFEDPKQKKSRAWIEKEDAKRANWEDRHTTKSRGGYEVESNVGYEYTQMIMRAVDQVNLFLRRTYQHKMQGQRMRKASVYVHKDRDEMMAVWGPKFPTLGPGVQAFYYSADNIVVAYDQRSVGQTTQDTMESVSHELSHQFLRDITANLVPAWINEGSACYLEGTVLLDNGRVISNLVAESRLKNLVMMFGMLERSPGSMLEAGRPESGYLEDVITYFQPGSYSGNYYPWGWGIVYFMRNYEDDQGQRIYREPFEEYVATFQSGGKRALKDEFVEYFVTGVGIEGVTTFDEFYDFWKSWIKDLHGVHFGEGDAAIASLLKRGDTQRENEFYVNALETYRRALRKNPEQIEALWWAAECNAEIGDDDVAMYYYRLVVEWANAQIAREMSEAGEGTRAVYRVPGIGKSAEELLEEAYTKMAKINQAITEDLREASTTLRDGLVGLAEAYAKQDELPRMGLATLQQAEELLGPTVPAIVLRDEILESGELDLRQRRRLRIDAELASWGQTGGYKAEGDSAIKATAVDFAAFATYADAPPAEYRLEVTVEVLDTVGDGTNVAGLFFGSGLSDRKIIAWESSINQLCRISLDENGFSLDDRIERLALGDGKATQIAIDVTPKLVTFYIDGEKVGDHRYDADEVEGRVGLFVQGAIARFSDLRMIY